MAIGSFWARYLRRRRAAAAAWLAVAALAVGLASQLSFDASYERLLDPASAQARELARAREAFGPTASELAIVLEGPADARQRAVDALIGRLAALDDVAAVDAGGVGPFFAERTLWLIPVAELRDLAARAEAGGSWVPRLAAARAMVQTAATGYGAGDDRAVVLVRPRAASADVDANRALLAAIAREIERTVVPPVSARIAGRPAVHVAEQDATARDLGRATAIAVVGIALLLGLGLRSWAAPLIIGVPVAVSLALTLAAAWLLFGELNILSGFALPALIGIGVDAGIHVSRRTRDHRAAGAAEPARAALDDAAAPALASALTTAVGFASLLVIDLPGVRELGVIGAVGAVSGAICAIGLVPLLDRGSRARPRPPIPVPRRGLGLGVLVYAASLAAAALAVGQLSFVNDFDRLSSGAPEVEETRAVEASLGAILSPAAAVVPTLADAEALADLARTSKPAGVTIARVVGAADLVPRDVAERAALIATLAGAPRPPWTEPLVRATPWTFEDVPPATSRRFVAAGGGFAVYLWPDDPLHRAERMASWTATLHRLEARARDAGIDAVIFDERRAAVAVVDTLAGDVPRALALGGAALLVVLVIACRALWAAALALGTLATICVWLAALLAVTGVHVNIYNALVIPVVVGLCIDNALHLLFAVRRRGVAALPHVLGTTGRAAALASATTAVGFGATLIADQGGLRSLGVTAVIGVAASFVAATVALPWVLAWWHRRRCAAGRRGQE